MVFATLEHEIQTKKLGVQTISINILNQAAGDWAKAAPKKLADGRPSHHFLSIPFLQKKQNGQERRDKKTRSINVLPFEAHRPLRSVRCAFQAKFAISLQPGEAWRRESPGLWEMACPIQFEQLWTKMGWNSEIGTSIGFYRYNYYVIRTVTYISQVYLHVYIYIYIYIYLKIHIDIHLHIRIYIYIYSCTLRGIELWVGVTKWGNRSIRFVWITTSNTQTTLNENCGRSSENLASCGYGHKWGMT